MTTHTPGPWHLRPLQTERGGNKVYPIEAFYDADGKQFRGLVAEIPTWNFEDLPDSEREEHLANARLIAAAPKMAEACRMLDAACIGDPVEPVMCEALRLARDALAAAGIEVQS